MIKNRKISDFMEINHGRVAFHNSGVKIKLTDFPKKYKEMIEGVKAGTDKLTLEIEKEGAALMNAKVRDDRRIIKFIYDEVFKWGGTSGNRVRGILRKHQTDKQIAKVIWESAEYLRDGNIEQAIAHITTLKGLSISFGSKILRMLSPQQAGVYDSILAGCMPYKENSREYVMFCRDCQAVADILAEHTIKNEMRCGGKWLVADIEMAIYRVVWEFHV